MSNERTMSPTAAQAHAKRIVRRRFKMLRENKRVDSPAVLASRLTEYARATAEAHPVEPSKAYAEWVHANFHEKFMELSTRGLS